MPELPEVETTRRGLLASIKGRRITDVEMRRADLRRPMPKHLKKALVGAKILDIRRRAKYLLIDLDTEESVLAHLGMSGSFTVSPAKTYVAQPHDHVLLTLNNGASVVFNDPRRFGVIDLVKTAKADHHPLLAHLGPEPLSKEFSSEYLVTRLGRRAGPIKPVLMDQKLVVGVGNIYASESLHACGISPFLSARKAAPRAGALIASIRTTLEAAIASGGSTLRNYVGVSRETGYFQHRFLVYGRAGEPCFSCGEKIQMTTQAGRATYWCAHCQPLGKKRLKS